MLLFEGNVRHHRSVLINFWCALCRSKSVCSGIPAAMSPDAKGFRALGLGFIGASE